MTIEAIEEKFRVTVCSQINLRQEGIDRYRVFTPFAFDDGDNLAIILKFVDDTWILTDEGHTLMHLTYSIDARELERGTRQKVITSVLSRFGLEDNHGELTIRIVGDQFGDALWNFVQALINISDLTYLSRTRVYSTFIEDLHALIEETVPEGRRGFDWHDPEHDPDGKYIVDCRINGMQRPVYIFALPNDDRVRDATISILQFERWGQSFASVGIFENQEEVNRKALARFSDVCDRQFSNLPANRDRIAQIIRGVIGGASPGDSSPL